MLALWEYGLFFNSLSLTTLSNYLKHITLRMRITNLKSICFPSYFWFKTYIKETQPFVYKHLALLKKKKKTQILNYYQSMKILLQKLPPLSLCDLILEVVEFLTYRVYTVFSWRKGIQMKWERETMAMQFKMQIF